MRRLQIYEKYSIPRRKHSRQESPRPDQPLKCRCTQSVSPTNCATPNTSGRNEKNSCSAPPKSPKAARRELRIVLRRWPKDALTTFTNSRSSQSRRCTPLRRRRMTALLTFGGGLKTALADGKQVFYIVKSLQKDTQDAVLFRSRRLGDTYRHLALHHADALRESGHGIRAPGKIFAKRYYKGNCR